MSTTSNSTSPQCYRCGAPLSVTGKVHRRDSCPKCGTSLHACKFCTFYDIKSYNECREPSADRVVDKEKENFCDFFQFNQQGSDTTTSAKSQTEAAKKKLDDLFK